MTSIEFVDMLTGEVLIPHDSDPPELLFRQVCAHVWDAQHDKPHMDAFGPQSSDERKPSFTRSSAVSAQESRDWHDSNARSKSKGVWACSVSEVRDAGARAIDDSETPLGDGEKRAPGHAFVDYRHTSTKTERKAIKAALLMFALERKEIPTVSSTAEPESDGTEGAPSDDPEEHSN